MDTYGGSVVGYYVGIQSQRLAQKAILDSFYCFIGISARPSVVGNNKAPYLQYVNDYHGGKYGFVSGHATNIVGIVTWLCYMFRTHLSRVLFIVFGATLCYSRIYLGVHFPGDILCGSLLGFFIARFGIALLQKYNLMFTTDRQPWFVLAAYILTAIVLMVMSFIAYMA